MSFENRLSKLEQWMKPTERNVRCYGEDGNMIGTIQVDRMGLNDRLMKSAAYGNEEDMPASTRRDLAIVRNAARTEPYCGDLQLIKALLMSPGGKE